MGFDPKQVVNIGEVAPNHLWVIYGRSNSGKDVTASSFPKPMLYIPIGDDGRGSIRHVEGIKTLPKPVKTVKELKDIAVWAARDEKYKTIVVSTFSLLVNEWKDEKVVQTKKRMSQQLWGDLGTDTEEIIRLFKVAAETHEIVLICHETMDNQINEMENEIAPNIRPSISPAARTYLEGVANIGIHCIKVKKERETDEGTKTEIKYGAHIGPNPYYWTKVQANPKIKLPSVMINPTYKKLMELLEQEVN